MLQLRGVVVLRELSFLVALFSCICLHQNMCKLMVVWATINRKGRIELYTTGISDIAQGLQNGSGFGK